MLASCSALQFTFCILSITWLLAICYFVFLYLFLLSFHINLFPLNAFRLRSPIAAKFSPHFSYINFCFLQLSIWLPQHNRRNFILFLSLPTYALVLTNSHFLRKPLSDCMLLPSYSWLPHSLGRLVGWRVGGLVGWYCSSLVASWISIMSFGFYCSPFKCFSSHFFPYFISAHLHIYSSKFLLHVTLLLFASACRLPLTFSCNKFLFLLVLFLLLLFLLSFVVLVAADCHGYVNSRNLKTRSHNVFNPHILHTVVRLNMHTYIRTYMQIYIFTTFIYQLQLLPLTTVILYLRCTKQLLAAQTIKPTACYLKTKQLWPATTIQKCTPHKACTHMYLFAYRTNLYEF